MAMRYLEVRLSQPTEQLHPMQRFIREGDAVTAEALDGFSIDPAAGLEYLLFTVDGDRSAYESALDSIESVRWFDLSPSRRGSFTAYVCQEVRETDLHWRRAFATHSLVVHLPIVYDERADFHVTVVGDNDDLQAMVDELPAAIDVTVTAIGDPNRRLAPIGGGLTGRQFEAIETAFELGFYDYPRTATLATVADALECAESTAATLLQRAESAVMERLVTRHGRLDAPDAESVQSDGYS
jgi:predicted DNA binding protein